MSELLAVWVTLAPWFFGAAGLGLFVVLVALAVLLSAWPLALLAVVMLLAGGEPAHGAADPEGAAAGRRAGLSAHPRRQPQRSRIHRRREADPGRADPRWGGGHRRRHRRLRAPNGVVRRRGGGPVRGERAGRHRGPDDGRAPVPGGPARARRVHRRPLPGPAVLGVVDARAVPDVRGAALHGGGAAPAPPTATCGPTGPRPPRSAPCSASSRPSGPCSSRSSWVAACSAGGSRATPITSSRAPGLPSWCS